VRTTDEMSVLYGPTAWYGVAEGMRLGGWIDGRYLPGPDFPRGLRSFEAGLNVGTSDGSVAWRAGYARRVGAIGARGSLRLLATQDAGLTRGELSVSNWITAAGRVHPWWTWTITGQYLDRDAEESFGGSGPDRVDPAYWSPGRTMNAGGTLRLDTKGPRRRETVTLDAWHGFDSDGGGAGALYDRVSLDARQSLALGARANFHLDARLYGGLASDDAPRERLFDGVQATRLETLDRFYANDRGPLRESDRYWTGGGGGLRGYVGRVVQGPRVAAGSLEARHDRWPVALFFDAARLRADDPYDRLLADAGAGIQLGFVRLDAPFWISTPEPCEPPFDFRWTFSVELPEVRWR